ncbi:MAG: hypothetical protein LBN26_00805 [Christensenellaceae bacterium]|nr:hypothetical protein [Christensenellaceae bacterium]
MNKHQTTRNKKGAAIAAKGHFLLVLLAILLISGAAFYMISVPRHAETAHAENGTLDLTGADFDEKIYALDGAWAFFDGQLYTPEDFAGNAALDKDFVEVPSTWREESRQGESYATYRLVIETKDNQSLMLHIPEISDAGVVFINGEKVHQAGKLGVTDDYEMSARNAFVAFQPKDGHTELIVWVSNFRPSGFDMNGLYYSFRVGSEEFLLQDAMLRRVLLAGILGLMLMMALYNFVLFMFNRKEKIYLWYILYIAVTAFRLSMESNGLVQLFAPGGMTYLLSQLYMGSMPLQFLFLILFTFEAFTIPYLPKKFGWRIVYAVSAVVFGWNVLAMMLPLPLPQTAIYLAIIPFAVTVFAAALRLRKGQYAGTFMGLYVIALLLFLFWGTGAKVLGDNVFFVPGVLSNLFMIISQCLVLAVNYAEARRKADELTAKTDFYRRMNHEMRTPLTKISTNIQIANRQPETDHERLMKSQDEIMRMSEMIDAALDDRDESGVIE